MPNETTLKEITRDDLLGGARLFIAAADGDFQVMLSDRDRTSEISLAAAKEKERAAELARTMPFPAFAYEMIGIENAAEPTAAEPVALSNIQDLLVEHFGEDAWIEISCDGWADYKFDKNKGAEWSYEFDSIKVARWSRDSGVLADLSSVEIEKGWDLLEMGEGARVNRIEIKCGNETLTRAYDWNERPTTYGFDDVVEKLILDWLK